MRLPVKAPISFYLLPFTFLLITIVHLSIVGMPVFNLPIMKHFFILFVQLYR